VVGIGGFCSSSVAVEVAACIASDILAYAVLGPHVLYLNLIALPSLSSVSTPIAVVNVIIVLEETLNSH